MLPVYSNTPPNNPVFNLIWVDISTVPNRQSRWNGFAWIPINGNVQSHAKLTNLDFDSAGHRGFAPLRHEHFLSELEGANDVIKKIKFQPSIGDSIDGLGLKAGAHVEIAIEDDTQLLRIDAIDVAASEHPHEQSDIAGLSIALNKKEELVNKGQPGGYAPLDSTGKVPIAHIPSLSFGGLSVVPTHTHTQYASITELATSNGTHKVDYSNLKNVPKIGHENYKAPVAFFSQLPLSNNSQYDIRLVTSEGMLYWWNGLEWNEIAFLNFTHANLNGNDADDHSQYFNEARGDVRYYTKSSANITFATKEEVNALSLGPSLQQTFPLQNNQITAQGTGYTFDATIYRGSSLIYMIERGVSLVSGNLSLAHLVSTPYLIDTRETLTTDVGITFTVSLVGDILILNYTSTDTGEAATLKVCEKVKFFL